MGREFAAMPEEERPENVLCVIITDGQENASKEFTADDVKKRIEHQQKVYQWEFIFLAANQDAFAAGGSLGLSKQCCADFAASKEGVHLMAKAICSAASEIRRRKK